MSDRTFFVTATTSGSRNILQSDRLCALLLDVLRHYRREKRYLLHSFVFMPNHIHLLITPLANESLEKCMQYIKGNFSFRAKQELKYRNELWTAGFNLHRITSTTEFVRHAAYIHKNPVKWRLVASPELFEYSSAWPGRKMDPSPFSAGAKAQSA